MQPDIFCRCLAENIYAPLSDFLGMCPNWKLMPGAAWRNSSASLVDLAALVCYHSLELKNGHTTNKCCSSRKVEVCKYNNPH